MIKIVGEADTIILHFAFYILHWAAQAARQIPIWLSNLSQKPFHLTAVFENIDFFSGLGR